MGSYDRRHEARRRRTRDPLPDRRAQAAPPRQASPSVAMGNGAAAADFGARVSYQEGGRPAPGAGNGAAVVILEPMVITARPPSAADADAQPAAPDGVITLDPVVISANPDVAADSGAAANDDVVHLEPIVITASTGPARSRAPDGELPDAAPATPEAQPTADSQRVPEPSPPQPRAAPPESANTRAANDTSAAARASPVARQEAAAQGNAPSAGEVAGEAERQIEQSTAIEIEMEPVVITAAPATRTRGGGGRGDREAGARDGDPHVVVSRWQGGVRQAGSGMPRPNMHAVAGGPARVSNAANTANSQRRADQQGLPTEAAANIAAPPAVEAPPAPPAKNPIPEQTAAIEAASDKRLPDQSLPQFVQTPVREVVSGMFVGGNWPRLGQSPVRANLFQLLVNPGAEELAQIPADANDPERVALEHARARLDEPIEVGAQIAEGESAPLVDAGPEPPTPLPPGLSTPVAQVVARVLASMDTASTDVVSRMRRAAYPRGVLAEKFPDIGKTLEERVSERMNTELREVAAAAGVSGDELDRMVDERKGELEEEARTTHEQITTAGDEATESVGETGQCELDAIEGARQATEEEIIDKQEAASGGNDPTVVNARRDLVIRWVRNHVTTQTTNYQKAGEKREAELNDGEHQRVDAYDALAQREEYQGLNPRPPVPPHDRSNAALVRQLNDFSAAVRAWTRDQVQAVRNAVRPLRTAASTATREHRTAVESAGNAAISAARTWAEDRILEGRSWWERFKARLERWFGDSREANEQWSVRRTEETRNAIAGDLTTINDIRAAVARGATREQLLQTQGLTDEQRGVINEYFQQPPGTHPLELAAILLRRRLASQYMEIAKPVFEAELVAVPDGQLLDAAEVLHTARPSFNGPKIAEDIHAQLDNFDSDEAAILRSLEGLSSAEGSLVRRIFRMRFGVDMDFAMSQALDYDEQDQARLRLEGNQAAADAAALEDAFGIINTDEKAIMDLLRGRSPEQIDQIRAEYRRRYGKELDVALRENLDEGNEQNQADALLRGDHEAADAIAIEEAMSGGLFGWGTSEEDIEATYKRVHDEVLALAQREGWSSEQMQAELRRRTGRIEAEFNERYQNVEDYQDPSNPDSSILRNAIASEYDPGPERDLANALASDDPIAADAARIEIERRGVWASDEAINNVLQGQYERALEETRLDQGPARQARVRRLRNELSRRDPPLDEEQISREVMALERQMETEMGEEAQRRSNISMEALDQAYEGKYTYPLWYTIEANMDGVDREKARALHTQGGHLTALQAVEYATEDIGTDEDALRNRLGNMTLAEIQQLRRDWERRHPGESFDDMLRGELSGRDESDIMDLVEHGAPESASERIDQERRRVRRELDDLTGVLGGLAAGNEEDWMREQMRRLDALEPDLRRTDLTEEQREQLRDTLDYRVELVQQAVEDHRRAIDSVANLAAQVASMVVAITVGAVLTAVSGGALGPVMIAVIASVAATITTMGTKALIQGGAYGAEDIGVDLAIGVVDAITAAATAGMGGRILRGAAGAGERLAQPTRVTQLLGNVGRSGIGQRVAESRVGQVLGRAASRFNQMESGFLTRGIQGENILARMARGDNRALRILAEGLAEGIENAASSLPSAFTGTALSDDTWKGNPLANLTLGTAMGVGTSVGMGAAMHGARTAYGHVKGQIHLATPEGRIAEANRILGEAYQRHRANYPDASYHEFLGTPEGIRARTEVEQRGLIGSRERASLEADPAAHALAPEAPGTPVENPAARAVAEAEADAARSRAAPPTDAQGLQPPAPHGDASVSGSEAKFAPEPHAETALPRTDTPPEGAAPRRIGDGDTARPAAMPEPEPQAHATVESAPSKPVVADPATQKLREGLPASLTDKVEVRVNPDLEGNAVRVIPDETGGPRRGVRVEVGPDATPTDVLLHAHTVQSMQRYQGLLGRLRQLKDWFYLTSVGSRGWEARLELEKLPGIIHERMQRLTAGGLDIESQVRLIDEIRSLGRQIDAHQRILESPQLRDSQGRGYVAAQGSGGKIKGISERAPDRNPETVRSLPHKIVTNTPLADDGTRVYRIGHEWQENGRVYRRVVAVDGEGRIKRVREEIQAIDERTGRRLDRWGQRGSESAHLEHGSGAVGEAGSRMTVAEDRFDAMVDADGKPDLKAQNAARGQERIVLDEAHLRNGSNNGFDGAFLRKNGENEWTMVLIEAKNQPAGIGLADFSAVRGKRLQENIDDLLVKLKDPDYPIEGLTQAHREIMIDLLERTQGSIEIQVHTTPDTPLGHRDDPRSSILADLERAANPRRKPGTPKREKIRVVQVPIAADVHAKALAEHQARDAIGSPSGRIDQLAGVGAEPGSIEFRQAQSMILAEGKFTNGLARPFGPGQGQFIDDDHVLFNVVTPTAHGRQPGAASVAAEVWQLLQHPAPEGAKGQPNVILDLSGLPPAKRREVLEYLKHIEPASLLDHVFIHDREAAKVEPFDPESV